MNENITVGFLGLSHLGVVSALSLASKGIRCIAVDEDVVRVSNLERGYWEISEPRFNEVYIEAHSNVTFTTSLKALSSCQLIYISTDVPTDKFSRSDLEEIESNIKRISSMIENETIIIILSQVSPGFSRRMRSYHGNIYYQVETLIFGKAFDRALNPERLIIGTPDLPIQIDQKFLKILELFNCPILPMSLESAEFCKISINAYLAASLTTTNALNLLAKSLGATWNDIESALKLDRRIGQFAYLKPGLGISGGNIERDLKTLTQLNKELFHTEVNIFDYYLKESSSAKGRLIDLIENRVLKVFPAARIGILGVAYKVDTSSTKNSIAIDIMERFSDKISGYYDPCATITEFGTLVKEYKSAELCVGDSDVVLILTPWPEFKTLDFNFIFREDCPKNIVIDPFNILNDIRIPREIELITLVAK